MLRVLALLLKKYLVRSTEVTPRRATTRLIVRLSPTPSPNIDNNNAQNQTLFDSTLRGGKSIHVGRP